MDPKNEVFMDEPTPILVPKIIHESIIDILEGYSRKLVIDICKTLNVDHKILLQELKKEKYEILSFEDNFDITNLSCKSYVLTKGVYVPCEEPVVYKKCYCMKHLECNIPFNKLNGLNVLSVLNYDTMKYYRNRDNIVYNSEFEPIGYYDESEQKILQFIIET